MRTIKKTILTSLLLGSIFALNSCSSDSGDATPVTPTQSADGKVHYATDVAPIISSNCIGCHANPPVNSAPMHLTTLDAVKDAIQNRGLLTRIGLPQGDPSMMPKNGTRLSQTNIDKIAKWQTDGFLN